MTEAMREMPKYKCHKEVWALKIKEVVLHAPDDPGEKAMAEFIESEDFEGGHIMPEDEGFLAIPIDAKWYRKHRPEKGGYLVHYKDGYRSYSPPEAFEDGYTKIS